MHADKAFLILHLAKRIFETTSLLSQRNKGSCVKDIIFTFKSSTVLDKIWFDFILQGSLFRRVPGFSRDQRKDDPAGIDLDRAILNRMVESPWSNPNRMTESSWSNPNRMAESPWGKHPNGRLHRKLEW